MEVWTLKNGKAYIVVYRAAPGVDKFAIQVTSSNAHERFISDNKIKDSNTQKEQSKM